MLNELISIPIEGSITRNQIEDLLGCELSLCTCNTILGAHGFVRDRYDNELWRHKSLTRLEPYRRPEDVSWEVVKKAIIGYTFITWRELIILLGFHASRKSIDKAFDAIGWTWSVKRRRWEAPNERE
jgi:hypothetical protein